jgi:peptidoglycan/xylan/chitin deacetylase (PgdA/CDA1 family)
VDDPEVNAALPQDMRISPRKLELFLRSLGRHYELCTVGDGLERLHGGPGRSLLALSMDDGYRDNARVLLPLLRRLGAPATVYLETRPLDERRLNWTHKFFWILERLGPDELVVEYARRCTEAPLTIRLHQIVAEGERVAYLLKRELKYQADPARRDGILDELFVLHGGDERALCDRLYMTWDDARRLHEGGVELGGHSVTHQVLATLPPAWQRAEIGGSRASLEQGLGAAPRSFAYPFGRPWDQNGDSEGLVREAGFASAVTTRGGTNSPQTDPMALRRIMIDENARLHLIAAEACGGFELLRRVGLDLSPQ